MLKTSGDATLSYKMFVSSEIFENWQEENPDIEIISVQPVMDSVSLRSGSGGVYGGIVHCSIFVLYRTIGLTNYKLTLHEITEI